MESVTINSLQGKILAEKRLNILANNIANISTPGFKSSRMIFTIKDRDTISSFQSTDTFIDFSPGPLVKTDNPLDLAIDGNGFFVVNTEKGIRYTRNGQFTLDGERRLVTAKGNPVLGKGGEIKIDGSIIHIESDGSVFVDGNLVDVLRIVDFKDKGALRYEGATLFVNTNEGSAEFEADHFAIKQGFFEGSNVNIMTEMLNLINVMRVFETYTKVSQFQEEMSSKLLETMKI